MSFKAKLLVVIGVALLAGSVVRAELSPGAAFPPLEASAFEGALPADLSGKVVLVDFWASWCAPCKTSFPALNKLHQAYSGRDFRIVAVSVDERRAPFEAFVARMKPEFSVVRDARQQLVAQVKVPTMPTSYLLDRAGKVRFVHRGFHDNTDEELKKEITQLLEEKP